LIATVTTGAFADTFKLTTGEEITGELLPTSANESGVQIKVGEGQYKRVAWNNFSQEDLKKFAQFPKLEPLVEPFIEITQQEKIAMSEPPKVKEPPHLDRLPKQSVLGAIVSSGVGLFILFVLWAATIYAGYEVALFRAQPPILVAGLSAVPFLGVLAPIVFLIMPTKLEPREESGAVAAAGHSTSAAPGASPSAEQAVNPMLAEDVAHPVGLKLADTTQIKSKPAPPAPQVFPRGQFTFNRRFFETKFPGFFGVVKREADKDMILVFKTARGEYEAQRISRITPNDLHLQIGHGGATQEVQVPFVEVREVVLRHKNSV
jgi:hypothetical protein